MNKKRVLEIKEYRSGTIKYIKEDVDYLNDRCFRYNGKLPYTLSGEIGGDNVCITNRGESEVLKSCTGVIELKYERVNFETKVPTYIIFMLSYLKSAELLFDPDKSIKMEEGTNFFDAIARQFLNEFDKINRVGLLEKFVPKCDNRDYLIGRLDIEGQIKNDFNGILEFSCRHDGDLDRNNLENKIVLRATRDLIQMIVSNENVRQELKNYEDMIRNSVDLIDILPDDCDKVIFDSDNNYYRKIIGLAKIILRNRYIKSTREGESLGFSFVTHPGTVVEDFLTQMLDEVVREDFGNIFTNINGKEKFYGMVMKRGSKIPDRTLMLKSTKRYPFPIDIKYKTEDQTFDYDQIAGYGNIVPGALACTLVYPETEDKKPKKSRYIAKEYDIRKDGTKKIPEKKDRRKLYICVIDLYMNKNLNYKEFIKGTKSQVRGMIIEMLQGTIKHYLDIDMKLDNMKLSEENQKIIYQELLNIYKGGKPPELLDVETA